MLREYVGNSGLLRQLRQHFLQSREASGGRTDGYDLLWQRLCIGFSHVDKILFANCSGIIVFNAGIDNRTAKKSATGNRRPRLVPSDVYATLRGLDLDMFDLFLGLFGLRQRYMQHALFE